MAEPNAMRVSRDSAGWMAGGPTPARTGAAVGFASMLTAGPRDGAGEAGRDRMTGPRPRPTDGSDQPSGPVRAEHGQAVGRMPVAPARDPLRLARGSGAATAAPTVPGSRPQPGNPDTATPVETPVVTPVATPMAGGRPATHAAIDAAAISCENDKRSNVHDTPPGLVEVLPTQPPTAGQPVPSVPHGPGFPAGQRMAAERPESGDATLAAAETCTDTGQPMIAAASAQHEAPASGMDRRGPITPTSDAVAAAGMGDDTAPAAVPDMAQGDPAAIVPPDTAISPPAPATDPPRPVAQALVGHAPSPHVTEPPHRAVVLRLSQALRDGEDALTITLNPARLGRVHVRLAITDHGVRVEMTLDRPQTFEAFREDAAALERQFAEAGISLADKGLDLRFGESSPDWHPDDRPAPTQARTQPTTNPVATMIVRNGLIDITA